MSDLVERLRERSDWLDGVAEGRDDASIVSAMREAAARIEALEARLAFADNAEGEGR